MALVEIGNSQFARWNAGDAEHPSMVALWDAALATGATLWGVASDDAHSYDGVGKYPAGGAWVMVDAPRDADAIIAALAAGRFYATSVNECCALAIYHGSTSRPPAARFRAEASSSMASYVCWRAWSDAGFRRCRSVRQICLLARHGTGIPQLER